MDLKDLHSPDQLQNLNPEQLQDLAGQIREFLIHSISDTGGHLSSNLGVVELTLAIHKVFHSPEDKIIFDVGHQCYTHKIITGRQDQFSTLRKLDGLSGFQKRSESEHDCWEAGHASTSLSACLGFAAARDLLHKDYEVVSVIGDGALGGGLALEALNDIGTQQRKMVVIFNDNEMSISQNISGLEHSLTKLRTSEVYRNTKQSVSDLLSEKERGKNLLKLLKQTRDALKSRIIDSPLFTQFNVDYLGPVDGHNLEDLICALQTAKEHNGPIVVHVITTKGKGYLPAENDQEGNWHGVSPFDVDSGKPLKKSPQAMIAWSRLISNTLCRLASLNPSICAITPAMKKGSCLENFALHYPTRFFDVGIAEEHAVAMAGAMAAGGLQPFVSIYSTFLQRAYDEILHDCARMNLPVVFGVDRAGLVGEDGDTHQGIYDVGFLRTIPNMVIAQPKNAREAQDLLYTAFESRRPFALRYPRGSVLNDFKKELEPVEIGSWTSAEIGKPEQVVISYGPDVEEIEKRARREKLNLMVVNARFLKPLDTALLQKIRDLQVPVMVYEPDTADGPLKKAILDQWNTQDPVLESLSLPDGYIRHGSVNALRKEYGVDEESLFERLKSHAS